MRLLFSRVLTLFVSTTCLALAQEARQDFTPAFSAESKLVLISFNVVRGAYFAPDVKREDVALLQDGKPREFTIFEGPGSARRPPLELALLFDTTSLPSPESKVKALDTHWDRNATYEFTSRWGEKESRSVLEKAGADVRVSVYRYDGNRLQRLCRSARDPQTLTSAIHRLPEPMPAEGVVSLTLPKGRMTFAEATAKRTGIKPNPNILVKQPCWTLEAIIDTLKDSTAEPSNATRALIVFSEMVGPTTTTPQDAADQAIAMGIPVYPVVLHYEEYMRNPFSKGSNPQANGGYGGAIPTTRPDWAPPYDPEAPRGSPAATRDWFIKDTIPMNRFGSVGPLTGAEALYPSQLDAGVLDRILNVVRDKSLSQYVIGFAPPSSGQQKKHRLEVKLKSRSVGKLTGGKRTGVY